ncbi:patatin family protein [Clostridium sp. MSJ-11]|uniref:Patatin family protein n=1 Tax=Clostridium mobile TaxID=2841512 RepID=A0ABS6EKP3_9CLOT|nr:patatin family protein [Clostridium mobile]MBU5485623.1 patatin family protein [Clostridium mobile]
MEKIGLVLEGGGMRGLYTAGVLDFFMEKNLYFPYVIGVSMGACNGTSYISKQIGRNKDVTIGYINDPRYISYRNFLKCKSIFGLDFMYNEIPNKLNPFDFHSFSEAKENFVVVATDCKTGEPIYFYKDDNEDILTVVKASASLPFISPIVKYKDRLLLDGGIADSIPVKKSMKDGFERNIIVLTRPKGYRKEPFKHKRLLKRVYSGYDNLIEAILDRYKHYNETLDYIEKLEEEGKVFIIRPKVGLKVGRIERNKEKLENLYKIGYEDIEKRYETLLDWVK